MKESQPAGATYGRNSVEQFWFHACERTKHQMDVHRANGTLPADRYAEST